MPHEGKRKALDTARDRDELCHSLEDVRKGRKIEWALAMVPNRLRKRINHIND